MHSSADYVDMMMDALGGEFMLTAECDASGQPYIRLSCTMPHTTADGERHGWSYTTGEMELWEFCADAREHWEQCHGPDAPVIPVPPSLEPEEQDIRTEVLRTNPGNGSWDLQKTVRVTHVPTGVTAESCDEKSQMEGKRVALAELRRKLGTLPS